MNLIKKFFGGKKTPYKTTKHLAEEILQGTLERGDFSVSFEIKEEKLEDNAVLRVEVFGEDEEYFTNRDGALLDAFQLFLKRAIQHHFPKKM